MELLRRIIRYSAQRGLCVMPDISRLHFDMPRVHNVKTECLTPEQGRAFLDALDTENDQNLAALVRLALATGMRRGGGILGLAVDDIDFQKGIITLRGEAATNAAPRHFAEHCVSGEPLRISGQGWRKARGDTPLHGFEFGKKPHSLRAFIYFTDCATPTHRGLPVVVR